MASLGGDRFDYDYQPKYNKMKKVEWGNNEGWRIREEIVKIICIDGDVSKVISTKGEFQVEKLLDRYFCTGLSCYRNVCNHIKYVRALIYNNVDESLRGKVIKNVTVEYSNQSLTRPVVTRIDAEELIYDTFRGELKRKIRI